MRRARWGTAAGLVLATSAAVASGTAGTLDPTFGGGDGMAVEGGIQALVRDVVVDGYGRTVAVGYTSAGRWWVARYEADGDLDPTFSGDGQATFFEREAHSVALDASGRILVGGGARWTSGKGKKAKTQTDFGLIRLLGDGSPDSTFGVGGEVLTDFGDPNDVAFEVLVQADGKIVVVGQSGLQSVALARYHASGALDTTFGSGGKRTHTLGLDGNVTFVGGLARDASGRYVTTVPGIVDGGLTQSHAVRFLGNGDLDASFGVRNLQAPYAAEWKYMFGRDVEIQPDGKIVVAGYGNTHDAHRDALLLRMNDDGTPDTSFADDGLYASGLRPDTDNGCAVERDAQGRLVLVWNRTPPGEKGRVCLTRLDSSGDPDLTFGTDGTSEPATYPDGAGWGANAAVLVPDAGHVVVGGVGNGRPILARWLVE
jgi:uncharacterized delta-60 repeat protein